MSSTRINIALCYPLSGGMPTGTAYIRILSLFKYFENDPHIQQFHVSGEELLDLLSTKKQPLNLIVIQRNSVDPQTLEKLIKTIRSKKVPMLYEIDDNLLDLPVSVDAKGEFLQGRSYYEKLIRSATVVTVATNELKALIQPINPNVIVIQNMLDDQWWFSEPHDFSAKRLDKVKILYMGTRSHFADLEMITPAARTILEIYPDVQFHIIGGSLKSFDWYDEIPIQKKSYPLFVEWFKTIAQNYTFAIAPLIQSQFTQTKSYIKFLDYSAVGLTGIYSRVGEYPAIVRHLENGLLVENNPEDWIIGMRYLIDHPSEVRRLAKNAAGLANQMRVSTLLESYKNLLMTLAKKH